MTNGSLMKVESIVECCNTFDLHEAIIGLENQFSVFLRVAVLHRFLLYNQKLSHFELLMSGWDIDTHSNYLKFSVRISFQWIYWPDIDRA